MRLTYFQFSTRQLCQHSAPPFAQPGFDGSEVMLAMLTGNLALHVRPRVGLVCAQLDPSRIELGRGGLYTPPPSPMPPIAVLADKQQLATLLASNWAEAAGTTGGSSNLII